MERKEKSSFKYKRRIDRDKWFDKLYDGNFGVHHCTLSNDEHGVIYIHNTDTKEHIASLVESVLYTNDSSFIQTSLHDNGLEFKNGLVKKRDITHDMPCGALDYYRKDAIKETKDIAIDTLLKVLEKYETSKTNIATIVSDFRKALEE